MSQHGFLEKRSGQEAPPKEAPRGRRTYSPSVDILETKDELLLVADMPGVVSENIDIHFENGELFLHGKVAPRQAPDQSYVVHEYGTGDYYRVFTINETIDAEKINAEYKDGVLTLHLPKAESAKPRKIAVTSK